MRDEPDNTAEIEALLAEQARLSNEFDEMEAQKTAHLQAAEQLQQESVKKMGAYEYLQGKIDALKPPAAEPHLAAVETDETEANDA